MIRCWLALTYYLYALRLAALSHFYFNRLYFNAIHTEPYRKNTGALLNLRVSDETVRAARVRAAAKTAIMPPDIDGFVFQAAFPGGRAA